METWIKVCGISLEEDIDFCVNQGISALGFLLKKNEQSSNLDQLTLERAKELISYVPSTIDSCLLIHSENIPDAIKNINYLRPSMVQIQSSLTSEDLHEIKKKFPDIKIMKTFSIDDSMIGNINDLEKEIRIYIDLCVIDFVLLDSRVGNKKGGIGITHDWNISAQIVKLLNPFPVILAGGLNPKNIREAIKIVKPFGVDVMTGVSEKRGIKSFHKITELKKNLKGAE